MKKRNCTIDLMKFVMALMIAFFHFYMATGKHFIGGSFAVEIFLLAASLFFFAKLERETAQRVPSSSESSPYIYKKSFYAVLPVDVFGICVFNFDYRKLSSAE